MVSVSHMYILHWDLLTTDDLSYFIVMRFTSGYFIEK